MAEYVGITRWGVGDGTCPEKRVRFFHIAAGLVFLGVALNGERKAFIGLVVVFMTLGLGALGRDRDDDSGSGPPA